MALRFMNDTRKPRHTIFGKLSYHQNIHYKLGKKICGTSLNKILIQYLHLFNNYLKNFGAGKSSNLSVETIERISVALVKISTSNQEEGVIKDNLLNTLYGLSAANKIIDEFETLNILYKEAKKDSDTLRDREKLSEYLDNLKKSNVNFLFDFGTISSLPLRLKPEYQTYIDRFGFPDNGVWNPVLLGHILLEQKTWNKE